MILTRSIKTVSIFPDYYEKLKKKIKKALYIDLEISILHQYHDLEVIIFNDLGGILLVNSRIHNFVITKPYECRHQNFHIWKLGVLDHRLQCSHYIMDARLIQMLCMNHLKICVETPRTEYSALTRTLRVE